MQYDAVIEVAKNRQMGVVDHLIGLYYEPESRRLKNSIAEHIVFGWEDEPTQVALSVENEFATNDFDPFGSEDDSPF